MERIVVLVEYGGGMFDGIHGLMVLTVPEDVDLGTLGWTTWKGTELRQPQIARTMADHLKAQGAKEFAVEWVVRT